MTTLHALIDWVSATRLTHPMLDADADALLVHLFALQAQQQAHTMASQQRASIALFGHSQASKAHLLHTLCGVQGNDTLSIRAGNKTLDYFSHINPGHALTQMAIRFSPSPVVGNDTFPLRLTLLNEAELVQLFIAYAWQRGDLRHPDNAAIAQRLQSWQNLRQPQPVSGITETEIATIARFWRETLPTSYQHIDDALWYQFAHLLPSLDVTARARAWSLLWGEQQELTQQWLTLAHALQQMGNCRTVMAPLSLLVDAFSLPMEAFLTPSITHSEEVLVHPLTTEHEQNTVSIPVVVLAQLTVELTLNIGNGVLNAIDIIDIPSPATTQNSPLWACKCRWLLDYYRQQQQPDILLICNATSQRAAIPATAQTLLRWVNDTHPTGENKLPGLVWAITPQDDRFVQQSHFDESVQQLVGKPGQHWGTLQALDHSSLQRLIEWLSQATETNLRQRRFTALNDGYQQQAYNLCRPLFASEIGSSAQSEAMIRELQSQAAYHGELLETLLPPLTAFDAICQVQQQREEKVSGLFNDAVDLFASPETALPQSTGSQDHGTLVYQLWCQHLRQWSRQPHMRLSKMTQQQLAWALITASQQQELVQRLQQASKEQQAGAAQLRAIIGNFINWLGYAECPIEQRPASRISHGCAIFVQPNSASHGRLTQLGEQPVHAATCYVYDWLVALYTRSTESASLNQQTLSDIAQQQLCELFDKPYH